MSELGCFLHAVCPKALQHCVRCLLDEDASRSARMPTVHWSLFTHNKQDSFLDSLHNVITGHRDFMIQIVHVAEFMTHHHPEKVTCSISAACGFTPLQISLPITSQQLSDFAIKCRTYAKALRFKELEFVAYFPFQQQLNGDVCHETC